MNSMFQDDGAIRVIEGRAQQAESSAADEGSYTVPADVLVTKFKKFVREFSYHSQGDAAGIDITALKYRDQLVNNCSQGFYKLELALSDLKADDQWEALAYQLHNTPTEIVPLCERALQDLYRELVEPNEERSEAEAQNKKAPFIQLILQCDTDLDNTFGTMKPKMIRELTSQEVEKLVVIQGIVTSVKTSRHKARKVVIKCSNCENVKELSVKVGFHSAHIPSNCDGVMGVDKCPNNPWRVEQERCEMIDEQMIKLQELPEHVPVGEMPRSFDLFLHQYLVATCSPGTRLTAVGIFTATEKESGKAISSGRGANKGTATVKYSYVQVLGLQVAQGNVGQATLELTPKEEEHFKEIARAPNSGVREQIFKSIAPSICASSKDVVDEVKKAIACLLFGGSRKCLPDGTRMRGDINVLLLGDPGTAKSQFLKFASRAAPTAVYTSGKGSSAAGLTAAVIRSGDGFSLEGGAMVLADGGIVCIDEFDKMDTNDRVAIHEAMEQQTISIAKAGITTMLNTRCSVLAAANPRFGSYDDLTACADQMDFETTILSRFDMMFLVKDVRDGDRDYALAKHMMMLHKGEIQEEAEGPLSVLELRKYISYARSRCDPRISAEAAEVLKNHYVSIRAAMKQGKSEIPITVRQLEAIIRISESLAKMELRSDVDITHVEEALRLFTVSTLDTANKDRGGVVGVDQLTQEQRTMLHEAMDQVRRLVPRGGRKNKFQLENLLVSASGIDERMARRAIHMMVMRGELEERLNNTLARAA
jgi:DNA replication licensing factor MCM5